MTFNDTYKEEHYASEIPPDVQLDKAIAIAARIHKGQKDKQGVNYILHPISVMMMASSVEEKILAMLHDTIEDSELTFEELVEEGFSPAIINALRYMTKDREEDYFDYIRKIKENHLALRVKLLDIENNLREGCPPYLRERYQKALAILKEPHKNTEQ